MPHPDTKNEAEAWRGNTPTQKLSPFRRNRNAARKSAPSRDELNESLLTASDGMVEGETNFASLLTRSNINVTSPSAWMESPIPLNKGLADEVESDFGFADIGENSMNQPKEAPEEKQDEVIEKNSDTEPSQFLEARDADNKIHWMKLSPQKPIAHPQKRRFEQSEQSRKRARISSKSINVGEGGPYAKYFRQEKDFYDQSCQNHLDELNQLWLSKVKERDEEQKRYSLDMKKMKIRELKIKARLIEQIKQAQYEKEQDKIRAVQMAKRLESQDRLEEIKDRGLQLERENIRMKNEIKRLKEKIGARAEEKRKETFYALYQALLPGVDFRPYGDKIQFENKGLQFVLGECYLRCVNFKEVTSEKIRRLFENADNATIETETMKDLKTLLKFLFKALNAKKIEDSSSVCTVPIIDQEPVLE